MKTVKISVAILIIAVAGITAAFAQEENKAQTICPIQAGPVNSEVFVVVDGFKIYACCPACLDQIKADPKAALDKIKANGETAEVSAE